MSESIFCPGCERHCPLTAPRCGRGKKYALEYQQTGQLPSREESEKAQQGKGEHHHGHEGRHEHHHRHAND